MFRSFSKALQTSKSYSFLDSTHYLMCLDLSRCINLKHVANQTRPQLEKIFRKRTKIRFNEEFEDFFENSI